MSCGRLRAVVLTGDVVCAFCDMCSVHGSWSKETGVWDLDEFCDQFANECDLELWKFVFNVSM